MALDEVAVIILTKNEQASLPDCLASLAGCDEVFVVDSESTDGTVRLAEETGAKVVPFTWNGKYPKKKQWALENCATERPWILLLDADERVSPELVAEIDGLKAGSDHDAYDISLDYVFLGRTLKHGHRVVKRALLRSGRARFPVVDDLAVTNMWEVEGHYQPDVDGSIGVLEAAILHDDKDSLFDYFARHNRYSDWEALLAMRADTSAAVQGKRSKQGQVFRRLPAKAFLFFLYSYVLRMGFRDGYPGFAYATVQAQYYWQIELKKREFRRQRQGLGRE